MQQCFDDVLSFWNRAIWGYEITIFHCTCDSIKFFLETHDFGSRKLRCSLDVIHERLEKQRRTVITLDRVFAADVDRRIDTKVSCVGAREGERKDKSCCKSPSNFRHVAKRLSSSLSRWGE